MPTQHDYNALADEMDLLSADLATQAGSLAALVDPALLTGGSIGHLVTRTVDQSTRDLSASFVRVDAVAAECRQRADACRRYTELLDGFDASMDRYAERVAVLAPGEWIGSPPWPPRPPGPWAERG